MKIALLGSSDSTENFLPEIAGVLEKEIINVEVKQFLLPTTIDLIAKLPSLQDYDLIFVNVLYRREDFRVKMLVEKLVAMKSSGVKLVIAVEKEDEDASREDSIKDYSLRILKELFGKNAKLSA